ncbi:hypothetical protein FSARC_12978 [Fusarium sarcochroum]|uniref:Uncharacterized protein n=1 Tax=Fusarium sarcochroum TaxID=1208366 RepID=A0A8H4T4Q5_9HYPO|nr:hypothetical protein FSARC_12978 [Fusarium sarcochroum]
MKAESTAEQKMKTALLSYPPQVPPLSSALHVKEALRSTHVSSGTQHNELQIHRSDECRSNNSANCLTDNTSKYPIVDPISLTFTHDRPAAMPSLLQLDEQDSERMTLSETKPSTLGNYNLFARDKRDRKNGDTQNQVQKEGFGKAVGNYLRQRKSPASHELEATSLMDRAIPLIRPSNSTSTPDATAQGASKASDLAPTPTDTGAFVCDTPSPELMYRFKGVSCLYVGFEDKVRPLPAQLEKWQKRIKPRLLTDIQEFENKMKTTKGARGVKPGLSPELRMSGYYVMGTGKVTLMPRIWILYDQEKWKKRVQAFVRDLEWLECEDLGDVEVRKGCPMLATVGTWPFINGLDLDESRAFRLANGMALYLQVEKPQKPSACGLVCCATLTRNGAVTNQRLSRIGGLICVNDETFGITAAHGMLEWLHASGFQDISSSDDPSDKESMCSDDTESEAPSTPDTTAGLHDDGTNSLEEDSWGEFLGSIDPGRIFQWNLSKKLD